MQRDPRTLGTARPAARRCGRRRRREAGGDDGGPQYEHKIGMYMMRGHDIYRRKVLFDSEEMEGEEVVDSLSLDAVHGVPRGGRATPSTREDDKPLDDTFEEEEEHRRTRRKASSRRPSCPAARALPEVEDKRTPLEQPPELIPRLHGMHVSGAWTESRTPAAARKHYTWRRNEQYLLSSAGARLRGAAAAQPGRGRRHGERCTRRRRPRRRRRRPRTPNKFLIGFVVAAADRRGCTRKRLHIEPDEIVDKTLFAPTFEVAAEFYSDDESASAPGAAAASYIIVPSTYDPGIHDPTRQATSSCLCTRTTRARPGASSRRRGTTRSSTGEWSTQLKNAGGCRNYPSGCSTRCTSCASSRAATGMVFLRQPPRGAADGETLAATTPASAST